MGVQGHVIVASLLYMWHAREVGSPVKGISEDDPQFYSCIVWSCFWIHVIVASQLCMWHAREVGSPVKIVLTRDNTQQYLRMTVSRLYSRWKIKSYKKVCWNVFYFLLHLTYLFTIYNSFIKNNLDVFPYNRCKPAKGSIWAYHFIPEVGQLLREICPRKWRNAIFSVASIKIAHWNLRSKIVYIVFPKISNTSSRCPWSKMTNEHMGQAPRFEYCTGNNIGTFTGNISCFWVQRKDGR